MVKYPMFLFLLSGPSLVLSEPISLDATNEHLNIFKCELEEFPTSHPSIFVRTCDISPLKNIVFSGGGARGVAFAGVVQAFEEFKVSGTPFRSTIESVSGSSAGAITAALFATGSSASDLVHGAETIDVSTMLDASVFRRSLVLFQSGAPLYAYIRDSIIENVCRYYTEQKGSFYAHPHYSRLKSASKESLQNLQQQLDRFPKCLNHTSESEESTIPRITFQHLKVLNKLDPAIFKLLAVVAVDSATGLKIVFSTRENSKVEIAKACRASASIPGLLAPVQVTTSERKNIKLVDGSLFDLIPINEVINTHPLQSGYDLGHMGENLATMVFAFEGDGDDKESSGHISLGQKFALDFVPHASGLVHGDTRMTETRKETKRRIREMFSSRTVTLAVPGISIASFTEAMQQADSLIRRARKQTMAFLKNYYATHKTTREEYTSAEEMVSDLAMAKLSQLHQMMDQGELKSVFGLDKDAIMRIWKSKYSFDTHVMKYPCSYKFGKISGVKFPCYDSPEFQFIWRMYTQRRTIHSSSAVYYKDAQIIVECYASGRLFGTGALIGTYTAPFVDLKEKLNIRPDVSKFRPGKRYHLRAGFGHVRKICSTVDSAETYFSHIDENKNEIIE